VATAARNRIGVVLLSILTSVALLHTSVTPAAACSCVPIDSEEFAAEVMAYYDLVVEGSLANYSAPDAPEPMVFNVERVYRGQSPQGVELTQTWEQRSFYGDYEYGDDILGPDCSYTLVGDPGTRYVLFLAEEAEGYRPGGCSSFALSSLQYDYTRGAYEAIQNAAGGGWAPYGTATGPTVTPGELPDTGGARVEDDARDELSAVAIALIALAVVVGAQAVSRRRH